MLERRVLLPLRHAARLLLLAAALALRVSAGIAAEARFGALAKRGREPSTLGSRGQP